MQQELQDLSDLLEGFIERDIDGALVLACSDVQVLYAAKLLAGIDERDEADVIQVFCEPVKGSLDAYVDAIAHNLETQLAVIDERCDAAGVPRWPRVPDDTRKGEASARMLSLMQWIRTRLPEGDHRLVWALLPAEIHDHDGFAALGEQLIDRGVTFGIRLILRDDADTPKLAPLAEARPGESILAHKVALDPGAFVDAVAQMARDPQQAPRDRMMALLQLAYLDLGYKRLADARQKFDAVAGFFAKTGDPSLQALAMGGAADAANRAGDVAGARAQYDAALVLAAQAGGLPVVLNHSLSLGALCRDHELLPEAESYYQLAALTAEKTVNPFARADALEQVGALQLERGQAEDAAKSWTVAAEVCREAGYFDRLEPLLGELQGLHERAGRADEARACAQELARIREMEA